MTRSDITRIGIFMMLTAFNFRKHSLLDVQQYFTNRFQSQLSDLPIPPITTFKNYSL